MIDAEDNNQMKFEQFHEVMKWTLKGIAKMFRMKLNKAKEIQIVSYKGFISADATNDNILDYNEFVNWIELNQQFIEFL